MDNMISVFKNKDLDLEMRTILNDDGSISVNAEDVAIGLGWIKTEVKNGKEYTSIRWGRMNGFSTDCGFDREWSKDDYIPESLFYMLAMKADNERAQRFQRWIAIDVVPAIRKTGSYGMVSEEVRNFMEKQIQFNQEMLRRFNDNQAGQSKNLSVASITTCIKGESESEKRIKMLNNLVAKMAKACGWEKRFAFHRLYKTLEEVLDISLDDYLEIHQIETGEMNISTLEMLVEYNRLYETAVRLCTNTINGMKCQ